MTLYVMLVGAYPFEDPSDPSNFNRTMEVGGGSNFNLHFRTFNRGKEAGGGSNFNRTWRWVGGGWVGAVGYLYP